MRAKMLCLPTYLDRSVALDAYQVWTQLSRACHRGSYDLDPTADELLSWQSSVRTILGELGPGESAD